jgi:hypothetical protein
MVQWQNKSLDSSRIPEKVNLPSQLSINFRIRSRGKGVSLRWIISGSFSDIGNTRWPGDLACIQDVKSLVCHLCVISIYGLRNYPVSKNFSCHCTTFHMDCQRTLRSIENWWSSMASILNWLIVYRVDILCQSMGKLGNWRVSTSPLTIHHPFSMNS